MKWGDNIYVDTLARAIAGSAMLLGACILAMALPFAIARHDVLAIIVGASFVAFMSFGAFLVFRMTYCSWKNRNRRS